MVAGAAVECAAPCLGYSFQTSQLVSDMIVQRLPVSATIAIGAAVLWLFVGLVAGVLSAVKEGRFLDRFFAGLTLGAMSIPNYVLALVLQFVFVVALGWLPFPQAVQFADDPGRWFLNFLMPWVVLAAGYSAVYTRLTRANVIETLQENFVRTARAKGLRRASCGAVTRCAPPSPPSSRSSAWTSPGCWAAPSSPRRSSASTGWASSPPIPSPPTTSP